MGTGFVMDSSKTSFAEVPVLLTHRVSAGDKPALSQLLQGLRQPAQALSHNREGKGQNQTLGKRAGGGGGEKKKNNKPTVHFIKCYMRGKQILPLLSFNQDERKESEIWG